MKPAQDRLAADLERLEFNQAAIPVVTMLQLLFDMMIATTSPIGYGHIYAPEHYIDCWIALTDPQIEAAELEEVPCPGREGRAAPRGGDEPGVEPVAALVDQFYAQVEQRGGFARIEGRRQDGGSIHGVPDSFARAYSIMMSEPQGPVYMVYDSAMQESELKEEMALPIRREVGDRAGEHSVAEDAAVGDLPSGPDPELLNIHPSGNPVYIANEDDNLVTVIDLERRRILKPTAVHNHQRAPGAAEIKHREGEGAAPPDAVLKHRLINWPALEWRLELGLALGSGFLGEGRGYDEAKQRNQENRTHGSLPVCGNCTLASVKVEAPSKRPLP